MNLLIHPTQELYGATAVPGDKSISHRAAMFAALAEGRSHVRNFLPGGDCQATLGVLRSLGVAIEAISPGELLIDGVGLRGLQEPAAPLDCINSARPCACWPACWRDSASSACSAAARS